MKPVKASRHPLWSITNIVRISLPIVVITVILVFWLSKSSVWVEWLLILLILSVCLFIFLVVGLYRGVRIARPKAADTDVAKLTLAGVPVVELAAGIDPVHVDVPGLPDLGDDLVGWLLTAVLWVIASIVIVAVFWLAMQIFMMVFPALLLGIYWVYYRALRVVFLKARACKGKIWHSLGYGMLYTLIYMGWLFVVTWLSYIFAVGRVA